MTKIKITRGQYALVDDADAESMARFSWSALPARRAGFYAVRGGETPVGQRLFYMHREIVGLPRGRTPQVDHIDGNGLNNCRENLRLATNAENHWNVAKPRIGRNRYKGVTFCARTRKFKAQIMVAGHRTFLGYFANEEEAARVYDAAATARCGTFAYLNLPQ
jgi:HNH endonuclease